MTMTKDIEKDLFDVECVMHGCNADLVDLVVGKLVQREYGGLEFQF